MNPLDKKVSIVLEEDVRMGTTKETRIQDWIAWMNRMLRMKEGKILVAEEDTRGADECTYVDYLRMKIRVHVSKYEEG